jgi:hypothetical protein
MGGKIKSGTKLKILYLRGFFVFILQGLNIRNRESVNMKIIRIAQFDYLEEDEENKPPVKSIQDVKSSMSEIVNRAQKEYDLWDESDIDTYAGGGICHIIADAIVDVLSDKDIEVYSVSSNFEQHVYCIVRVIEGIYEVDIHHSTYETGGGYTWSKLPNIIFEDNDIFINRLDYDYDNVSEYVEME